MKLTQDSMSPTPVTEGVGRSNDMEKQKSVCILDVWTFETVFEIVGVVIISWGG